MLVYITPSVARTVNITVNYSVVLIVKWFSVLFLQVDRRCKVCVYRSVEDEYHLIEYGNLKGSMFCCLFSTFKFNISTHTSLLFVHKLSK